MFDYKYPSCCEHCLNKIHCNSREKSRCPQYLNYISHLHTSNAHQELISELKILIAQGSKYSCEGRYSV